MLPAEATRPGSAAGGPALTSEAQVLFLAQPLPPSPWPEVSSLSLVQGDSQACSAAAKPLPPPLGPLALNTLQPRLVASD